MVRKDTGFRIMLKVKRMKNAGSAVIEACLVIPLFLLLMLFVIYLYRMLYVDAHIHQSLCEASVYCAKRCYLEDRLLQTDQSSKGEAITASGELSATELSLTTGIVYARFNEYMGSDPMVKRVVAGGQKGIIVTVTKDVEDGKVFITKASYMTRLDLPIFGSFMIPRSLSVKQKAFVGVGREDMPDDEDIYVYITPNESVYHVSRSCSHLTRTVRSVSEHKGYEPCSFCGKEGDGAQVYVTDSGDSYHYNLNCLGLKRTVMRVKKRDVAGLGVCSRCGR